MNLKYIDTHSHLNIKNFEKDLNEVIKRMQKNSIGTVVIGVDKESSKRAVDIAEKNKNIWACVGFQPIDYQEKFDKDFLKDLVLNPNVVAIGECGLDYFHQKDDANKGRQKELFESQIDFAVENDLPLVLHVRDAHIDALEILKQKKKEDKDKLRGISHFFTSTLDIAKEYTELGFLISISGVATFSNSLDEVIKKIDIENLLIETDSPFAAPLSHRGKRNEPSFVVEVSQKIAQTKSLKEGLVSQKLLKNTKEIFSLEF